jgi:hypothetical protein
MELDLLINKTGEYGIVTTHQFEAKPSAAFFDHDTLRLSLEFSETMDSVPLNVTVALDHAEALILRNQIYFVVYEGDFIVMAETIPLIHTGATAGSSTSGQAYGTISQAEYWLKTAIQGQPIHRDNLGHENASGGVMRGVSPKVLRLAPQLQRQLAQERANAPKPAPALTVPTMGMGGNSGGGRSTGGIQNPNLNNRHPKPPTDMGE